MMSMSESIIIVPVSGSASTDTTSPSSSSSLSSPSPSPSPLSPPSSLSSSPSSSFAPSPPPAADASASPAPAMTIVNVDNGNGDANDAADAEECFGVDPATKDMNVIEFYTHLLTKFPTDRTLLVEHLRSLGFFHHSFLASAAVAPAPAPVAPSASMVSTTVTSSSSSSFSSSSSSSSSSSRNTANAAAAAAATRLNQLAALSRMWAAAGVVTTSHTADEFAADEQLTAAYTHSIVILKYIELYGARFWRNVWAKEMRGTVLFVHPETKAVKILSFKLPRGAEAMTGMVKHLGLDTQDVKPGKIAILDDEQRDTCMRLSSNGGSSLDAYLTSKGDGSLLIVNVYSGVAKAIMNGVVEVYGDAYVKSWRFMSLKLTSDRYLILPSTQGTLMEAGFMAPYMVTSMLVGSNIVARATLQAEASYETAWDRYGEAWLRLFLSSFRFFDDLSEVHCVSFEAMCRYRCGLFGDRLHVELAVSYERDRLIFLGVSVAEKRFYLPHPVYMQLLAAAPTSAPSPNSTHPTHNTLSNHTHAHTTHSTRMAFEEPLWWRITHSAQVDAMIAAMSDMIFNKLTVADFLRSFPPSSSLSSSSSHTASLSDASAFDASDVVIDYEGWVLMKVASLELSDVDHSDVSARLRAPVTIYSKIKTEPYYRSHKFRESNIPYLTTLASTGNAAIFPLARRVASLCGDGIMSDRLIRVGAEVMALLNFASPDNIILPQLRAAFAARVEAERKTEAETGSTAGVAAAATTTATTTITAAAASSSSGNGKKTTTKNSKPLKDPLVGFEKRPFDVQCRMALNFPGFNFAALLVPIYVTHFPELLTVPAAAAAADQEEAANINSNCSDNIGAICRGLTMELKPWSADYATHVQKLNVHSGCVQGLIAACLGQTLP